MNIVDIAANEFFSFHKDENGYDSLPNRTIVFSLWGVNVPVPGNHSPMAFAVLVLGTLAAMVLILYVLLKKRWL